MELATRSSANTFRYLRFPHSIEDRQRKIVYVLSALGDVAEEGKNTRFPRFPIQHQQLRSQLSSRSHFSSCKHFVISRSSLCSEGELISPTAHGE